MRNEFDRLRRQGVIFDWQTLRVLALRTVNKSFNKAYNAGMMHSDCEISIIYKITFCRIQLFGERYGIVSRDFFRKLQPRPTKENFILKEVAFYLGLMCLESRSGELHENNVAIADETHFVTNMDNSRTNGFKREEEVR